MKQPASEDHMRDTQLEKMSVKELEDLQRRVHKVLAVRQQEARQELREKFRQLADEAGVSLSEIIGVQKGAKVRGSVAPKYMNPEDNSETWSGRGRMPNWLSGRVKGGEKIEKFLIGGKR